MREIETWLGIPSCPGYEISSIGNCRSVDRSVVTAVGKPHVRCYKGKLLKPGLASNGYLTVVCSKGNTRCIHDLVAEAFIGPRPEGTDVAHKDGDKVNNKVSNLEYLSRSENNFHFAQHGKTKYSKAEIEFIRTSSLSGYAIAKLTGMSTAHVYDIRKNKVRTRG